MVDVSGAGAVMYRRRPMDVREPSGGLRLDRGPMVMDPDDGSSRSRSVSPDNRFDRSSPSRRLSGSRSRSPPIRDPRSRHTSYNRDKDTHTRHDEENDQEDDDDDDEDDDDEDDEPIHRAPSPDADPSQPGFHGLFKGEHEQHDIVYNAEKDDDDDDDDDDINDYDGSDNGSKTADADVISSTRPAVGIKSGGIRSLMEGFPTDHDVFEKSDPSDYVLKPNGLRQHANVDSEDDGERFSDQDDS